MDDLPEILSIRSREITSSPYGGRGFQSIFWDENNDNVNYDESSMFTSTMSNIDSQNGSVYSTLQSDHGFNNASPSNRPMLFSNHSQQRNMPTKSFSFDATTNRNNNNNNNNNNNTNNNNNNNSNNNNMYGTGFVTISNTNNGNTNGSNGNAIIAMVNFDRLKSIANETDLNYRRMDDFVD